jgi:O-antigen/teichoic acid export membrane protein
MPAHDANLQKPTGAGRTKLARNILYNLLGQALLLGLGFVAVKFVFKRLGEDALGIIYFTLALNTLLSTVMGMGMGESSVREISAHFGDEPGYIRSLVRTASLVYWALYALLVLGTYWLAPVLVHDWIHLKTLSPAAAVEILRILGAAALLALPRSFYVSLLRGLERMEFNNLIDVATGALQQFGTIVILLRGGGLMPVIGWLSICFAAGILGYLGVCGHFFSFPALLPGFSRSVARRNAHFTSRMASISVLASVHIQADKAIVSKLLPIGDLGFYGIAYSAISRATLFANGIAQAAFPHFSSLFKAGDQSGLASQYRKLQDLTCLATVPLFAGIIFAAKPLFTVILSAGAARMLLLPAGFLCLGFYMNGTLTIPYVFSLAAGRPDIAARSNFYALFAVLPAAVLFIYWFGLAGAGFSWVFYHLFAYSYQVPRTCHECLNIPVRGWYFHVLKVLLIAGLSYGAAGGILRAVGNGSLWSLALGYAGASAIFAALAYRLVGRELRGSLDHFFALLR